MITISKETLERMYLTDRMTLSEIGKILGCTRQNVHYLLRKFSVAPAGSRFLTRCDGCGLEFSITRKRFVQTEKHFHSKACYTAYMQTEEYRVWLAGQRHAREVLSRKLGRRLRYQEVVHFVDGDPGNLDPRNLMAFESHEERMKFIYARERRTDGLQATGSTGT